MNAYAFFSRDFPRHSGSIFLQDGDRSHTYADLERETARYAQVLAGLGLSPGDRVAAQVEKSPQAFFLYLATLRAGLAFLPLNTAYKQGELEYFLGDAEPRVVVCDPKAENLFRKLLAEKPGVRLLTLGEGNQGSLSEAAGKSHPEFATVPRSSDDLAVILYTSGTTGRSKGAMVTHGNLTSNAETLRLHWRITGQDVLIHALPAFHIHGLFVALHPLLLAGARILMHRKFDARAILADLPRATLLMGVPTFYVRLLAEPGLTRATCARMRLFVSGSAPLLMETFEAFRERTGHTILERYGMSEAGMITSNPYDGERRGGTVGMPLPGVELRVVGSNLKPMPFDMPGDIQIRGPNVFKGYWRMPEKTKEEFTEDGWFKTGDVGTWTWGGWISISGRARDLIISGGYNVYPKEIELALDELPGVEESAVIGVPDADFGEAVVAVIVPKKGSTLDSAGIIAKMKASLANYKVPKRVHVVEELPRNTMGKVQKNKLREMFG
ncbi:MAG TPA: malonyl-CoA synthase [Burkholderiales bacterium]|nr:malonyl-CoA synthase [Burkholderiales bacterium]